MFEPKKCPNCGQFKVTTVSFALAATLAFVMTNALTIVLCVFLVGFLLIIPTLILDIFFVPIMLISWVVPKLRRGTSRCKNCHWKGELAHAVV
jgi:hypothetical protein